MTHMPEVDAILDLACDCYRMSVVKTRWYGVNAGRRYRTCPQGRCGYHVWIDEEPLGDRTLEIIKFFQDRQIKRDEMFFHKLEKERERHDAEIGKLKKKQLVTVAFMFVVFSVLMNLMGTAEDDVVEELDAEAYEDEDVDYGF